MKIKLFKLVIVLGISGSVFADCLGNKESKPEVTPTEVPKSTSETADTVTLEPTPVEDRYVELTEEEISKISDRADVYGSGLMCTGTIVAYYKYIGLEELEVPVMVCYPTEEAKERFGGEWEHIPGWFNELEYFYGISAEDQNWIRGKLTIAEIEHELLYGDNWKIYIINDYSVESSLAEKIGPYNNIEVRPFAEYMRYLRHYGQYFIVEDKSGKPIVIDSIYGYD